MEIPITLFTLQWGRQLDNDEPLSIRCPNREHDNKHLSVFIRKVIDSDNQVFIFCHSCGSMGTFLKITRSSIFKSSKGMRHVKKSLKIYYKNNRFH